MPVVPACAIYAKPHNEARQAPHLRRRCRMGGENGQLTSRADPPVPCQCKGATRKAAVLRHPACAVHVRARVPLEAACVRACTTSTDPGIGRCNGAVRIAHMPAGLSHVRGPLPRPRCHCNPACALRAHARLMARAVAFVHQRHRAARRCSLGGSGHASRPASPSIE